MPRDDIAEHIGLRAWEDEGDTYDESTVGKFGRPGWHAWNNMSPEVEVCETAAQLVRMVRPLVLVETGVGQGYATRRIAAAMPADAVYHCYESDNGLREALRGLPFFTGPSVVLAEEQTPSVEVFAAADFAMLDSAVKFRDGEIRSWWEHAHEGAYVFIHDTGNGHPEWTPHFKHAQLIRELGIPGVFFANPRGSFLGQKR